jgi:hypothetical protein
MSGSMHNHNTILADRVCRFSIIEAVKATNLERAVWVGKIHPPKQFETCVVSHQTGGLAASLFGLHFLEVTRMLASSILHMLNSIVYLMKSSKLIELKTEQDDLWFFFTFFKIKMSPLLQELDLLEPKRTERYHLNVKLMPRTLILIRIFHNLVVKIVLNSNIFFYRKGGYVRSSPIRDNLGCKTHQLVFLATDFIV